MLRRGFRAAGDGMVLRISDYERDVLIDILQSMESLVEPGSPPAGGDPLADLVGIADSAHRPQDPALLRLLPDAYSADPEAASDFRRFTERDLRVRKAANAAAALGTLRRAAGVSAVRMSRDEAQAWLLALNDVRLTLAVRLGIGDEEEPAADPRTELYDWLTWLQSGLVDALMP